MNILQINTMDSHGGAAKIASAIHRGLKVCGHRSDMFVKLKYSDEPNIFVARWPNLATRVIKKLTGKDLGSVLSAKLHYLLATDIDWFNSDRILLTKEFKKADVVHCHNVHGNFFKLDTLRKMAERKPVVWTFHDMWPITAHCYHNYGGTLIDGFYQCPSLKMYQELLWNNQKKLLSEKRKIYARSNFHIVVPSLWLKEKVEKSVLRNHSITLIHNGIDEKIFSHQTKSDAREKLSLPQDKKIILFISAIGAAEEKGGKHFESTVKHSTGRNDLLFICIGENEKAVRFKQANLIHIPYIKNSLELAEYYSASDVLLSPSLAESFGLVIIEALSCGLPVVSFDVGVATEAVDHEQNGYIAEYGKTEDLIRGVEFILSLDENDKRLFSERARKRVLDLFTFEKMCKSYFALYKQVIEEWHDEMN